MMYFKVHAHTSCGNVIPLPSKWATFRSAARSAADALGAGVVGAEIIRMEDGRAETLAWFTLGAER